MIEFMLVPKHSFTRLLADVVAIDVHSFVVLDSEVAICEEWPTLDNRTDFDVGKLSVTAVVVSETYLVDDVVVGEVVRGRVVRELVKDVGDEVVRALVKVVRGNVVRELVKAVSL